MSLASNSSRRWIISPRELRRWPPLIKTMDDRWKTDTREGKTSVRRLQSLLEGIWILDARWVHAEAPELAQTDGKQLEILVCNCLYKESFCVMLSPGYERVGVLQGTRAPWGPQAEPCPHLQASPSYCPAVQAACQGWPPRSENSLQWPCRGWCDSLFKGKKPYSFASGDLEEITSRHMDLGSQLVMHTAAMLPFSNQSCQLMVKS